MGAPYFDNQLRNWIDEKTDNLLTDYTKEMSMPENTAAEIVSTVYLKGAWDETFDSIPDETFHGESGDKSVPFMESYDDGYYYYGDHFSAMGKGIHDGGSMWLILPNENSDPQELLNDDEVKKMLDSPEEYEKTKDAKIHAKIPKFSVESQSDLTKTLQSLGITDAFNKINADFSNLVNIDKADNENVYVSKAEQGAKLEIDENGILGAAYTKISSFMLATASLGEDVDFTLDRPFLFVVKGANNSILFAGTIYDIEN